MIPLYPLHARHVRPTTVGPLACEPDHPKARVVYRRHPMAHLFEDGIALCGFDDFDKTEPVDVVEVDEDLGHCPPDWERLICGDCDTLAQLIGDGANEDREPWENIPPIEGVRT